VDIFDDIYQSWSIEPRIIDTFDLSVETKTLVERKMGAYVPVTLAG
jgi:hypothetical protein